MERSEVWTSVVKWSEGLSNRVSISNRRYIDNMKLAPYILFRLSHSFVFSWFCFVSLCIWLYILYVFI